jgi:hypothetical protein
MLRTPRSRQVIAGILVSVVTLAVIGVVLVAMTPVGCGPANAMGIKSIANRCKTQPVAALRSPSPSPFVFPTPSPLPYTPPASPPYYPPASQPYYPPASGPYNPGSSPAFPPFYPPASGAGGGPVIPPIQLSCTLPVYAGPPGSGGFISFPLGTFTADPKSGVTLPSPSPGSASPSPQIGGPGPGYGYGYPGLSWDVAQKKWLPVPYTWVTPDGSKYAYTSPNSIYVEDVAANTQVELGEGKSWQIIGVLADGVYAMNTTNNGLIAGLWVLPFTSPAHQVTTSGYWQGVTAGAAYGTAVSAVPQGVSTTIIKLDLKTGAVDQNWFTRQGTNGNVVGFDSHGNPIIYLNSFTGGANEVWISTGSNVGTPIMGSQNGVFVNGTPIADSHGVWFSASIQNFSNGSNSGQLLYVPNSGVYVMSQIGGQLAGGCN